MTAKPAMSAPAAVAKAVLPAATSAPAQAQVAAKTPAPALPTVKFELYERNARAVFVAGSFNAWNPTATPLKANGSGKWEAILKLSPGKYQYRFVVDGKWIADPSAKETVPNPFEGVNSVLVVQ
jgi:1,4-alpha-glucan branching enzyme